MTKIRSEDRDSKAEFSVARRRTHRTVKKDEEWYVPFLEHLAKTGNVSWSAKKAGISRNAAYMHYGNTPSFAKRWDDAIDESADVLEKEALIRAVKGRLIDGTRKYSDTLLIFLLKGARPEKYRDNYDIGKLANELALARATASQSSAADKKPRGKTSGKE